jgi:hypothetical protein
MRTSIKVRESVPIGAPNMDDRRTAMTQAVAAAEAIGDAIASNPNLTADGKRRLFVKTGTLSRGMDAVLDGRVAVVVAPVGYLDDDRILERFYEAVPIASDPLRDKDVERAWQHSVDIATDLEER